MLCSLADATDLILLVLVQHAVKTDPQSGKAVSFAAAFAANFHVGKQLGFGVFVV